MQGKKTNLRSIEISDVELIRNWNFDSDIREFLPPSFPISLQEQYKWFEKQVNDNSKKKMMIIDSENKKPIGLISVMKIDHVNKNCEIGWTIGDKDYWGKGFAADAVYSICKFLFMHLNMNMIYAMVLEPNKKSINFCKSKLGFQESGRYIQSVYLNGQYHDNIVLCLLKSNFK